MSSTSPFANFKLLPYTRGMGTVFNLLGLALPFVIIFWSPIKDSYKQLTRRLLLIHILILCWIFLPLILVHGEYKSLLQYILAGSIDLIILVMLWIVSALFLLKKHPNFYFYSWIIFMIGYIFLWRGLLHDLPNTISGNYTGLFLGIEVILPLLTNLLYLVLNIRPTGSIPRTGLPKLLLDTWGSNRSLLHALSQRFNLSYTPHSGEKEAVAQGEIDKHTIAIRTDQWYQSGNTGRYSLALIRFLKVVITLESSTPGFLITNSRAVLSIPQLSSYRKLNHTMVHGFYVYTNSKDFAEITTLITKALSDFQTILHASGQRFIFFEGNELQFAKKYSLFSVGLSEADLVQIINTMILLAKKLEA